jgi:hypothetical protein
MPADDAPSAGSMLTTDAHATTETSASSRAVIRRGRASTIIE